MQLKTVGESSNAISSIHSILSNHLLNTEDIFDQITQSLSGYSTETLKAILTQKNLAPEQIKAILIAKGYQGALLETTTDELANIASTNAMAKSQKAATGSTTGLSNAFKGLIGSIKNMAVAHPVLAVITALGVTAFSVAKTVDALTTSTEEYDEQLETLKQQHSEVKAELQSMNSELETTEKRLKELEVKDTLTFSEKEEYDNLVKTNNELERSIALLKLEEKEKNKEKHKTFIATMESDVTKNDKRILTGKLDSRDNAEAEFITETEYIKRKFTELKELKSKLDNATTDYQRENYQKQINNIEEYLSGKNTEFTTRITGISYIEKPTSEDDEKVNAWLDYVNDFQNKMAIAMGAENAKTITFNRLVDNWYFDDTLQSLQDLGKEGKVTADMLNNSKYDEFIQKLVDLGFIDSADNLDEIALAFNNVANSVESATQGYKTDSILGISSTLTHLNTQLKPALDSLSSAWKRKRQTPTNTNTTPPKLPTPTANNTMPLFFI